MSSEREEAAAVKSIEGYGELGEAKEGVGGAGVDGPCDEDKAGATSAVTMSCVMTRLARTETAKT